jgi:hypothetical protein
VEINAPNPGIITVSFSSNRLCIKLLKFSIIKLKYYNGSNSLFEPKLQILTGKSNVLYLLSLILMPQNCLNKIKNIGMFVNHLLYKFSDEKIMPIFDKINPFENQIFKSIWK